MPTALLFERLPSPAIGCCIASGAWRTPDRPAACGRVSRYVLPAPGFALANVERLR
jgi:hypothetical protein